MTNEVHLKGQQTVTLRGIAHGDELIAEHLKNEPKKSSPEHHTWKRNYNIMVDVINKLAGTKRYFLKK